uniref:Uncharacterized protein n=1 Tax=Nelumbo nucifera TaxID=4432 RepID=A0A822ZNL0_NELNU|nr:TPA_asm: hypothetical protein HUJ06_003341 [Nelumbo nucifera]
MQGSFPSLFVLPCKDRQMKNNARIVGGQILGRQKWPGLSFVIRSFSKACKLAFLRRSFSHARIIGGQNREGKSSKVARNDKETRRLSFSSNLCPERESGDAQK